MKNRHGVEYHFEEIEPGVYTIRGELKYWRFGGKEGTAGVDMMDLGFVDAGGGPYIAAGSEIEGRKVLKISARTIWKDPFHKEYDIRFELASETDVQQ